MFRQKEITEKTFKIKILDQDKKAERDREVLDVLQNFVAVGRDVLWSVTAAERTPDEIDKAEQLPKDLCRFTRADLEKLEKVEVWSPKNPKISERWSNR